MVKCRNRGCNYTAPEWYSISKHEPRCRWKQHPAGYAGDSLHSPSAQVPTEHQAQAEGCFSSSPLNLTGNYLDTDISLDPDATKHSSNTVRTLLKMISVCLTEIHTRVGAQLVDNLILLIKRPDFSHSEFVENILSALQCVAITRKNSPQSSPVRRVFGDRSRE